jgi:hypothetical protein
VEDGTPDGGETVKKIDIAFNVGKSTGLTYHEDSGLFTAFQYGADYADGNTGDPVTFRNVFALEAPTRVLDGYGRLRVDLIGSGAGYYACGGKYETITWSRESLADCFHYTREDGSPLSVGVGTTYIAVLAKGQSEIKFT